MVDAQLPRLLARRLSDAGHDAIHCLDLPLGNRTPDDDISTRSVLDNRVVVTKDSDFVTSFLLYGLPRKLLLISTGNISNEALLGLVLVNLATLESALAKYNFVELSASSVIIHG